MDAVLTALAVLVFVCYGIACLLLLALPGTGYVIAYVIKHIRPAAVTYAGFLSWAFGTKEARQKRNATYLLFVGTMALYVADIVDSATPGLSRSGNIIVIVMFLMSAILIIADHREYFR